MSKEKPRAKWVLPTTVHPAGRKCYTIEVPDDPMYLAAFRGAILNLASATQWQDDIAHTAKEVAQVWRDIYFNALRPCVKRTDPTGILQEEFMPLRIDCDCNVWITCCDGTEKQLLTAQQVQQLIDGTTPGNAPQPTPGGCQTYHNYVTGLATELVPFPVSTGDTIEIQNIDGGTNGNNIARWNCGTGDEYFGGGCVGFPDTNGANRLPGVPTGTVIVNIAGVWYDGRAIITVPGGISNVQPVVALNYDPTYPASGTITYDVVVCNNQIVTWCHIIDFASLSGGFLPNAYGSGLQNGTWVAGSGWQNTDNVDGSGEWWRGASLQRDSIAAFTITNIEMTFDLTHGTYDSPAYWAAEVSVYNGAWQNVAHTTAGAIANGNNQVLGGPAAYSGVTKIYIDVQASAKTTAGALDGGPVLIKQLKIQGTGSNPFGTSNC